jgi:chromosomal replication initiator protein
MNAWDVIKSNLSSKLSHEAFENWVSRTELERTDGDKIWVAVPDDATRMWLEEEYGDRVEAAIRDTRSLVRTIVYITVPGVGLRNGAGHVNGTGTTEAGDVFGAPVSALNPRFSFGSFVVGACNQFAHAAAKAVSSFPASKYNPLFIYGGVGMGKTHLMHAIGLAVGEHYGSMRVVYTSSEKFMNQMIECIKRERMSSFQQHYRQADVLLIDDIQIIAGREKTQDEFFHTFNELYEHQKQIVISSDQPPKNIPGLVERLRSRFEWGLMVDMQPPDLETKMAILDKKAEQEGVRLPDDVRIFIASKTKSNVRELEGTLVKLIAYASVANTPITLGMAQQVLRHLTQHQSEKRITLDMIVKVTADHFGLQPAQLKLKTNAQHIAYPRQVAMYLAKEMTAASLPEIGKFFNGKHHTTVLHSVQKIEKLRHEDVNVNRMLHGLIDSLS